MRQKYYMIFYRPKGSQTWTPAPDWLVRDNTDRNANLTTSVAIAEKIKATLNDEIKINEYTIFRCEETHVCSTGGGRVDFPDAESAYRKTQNPDYMREKEQETGD